MGDFPGHAQIHWVLSRLRSELKKSVLEAAAPRVFDADWLPVSGGYGLDLPAHDLPENWLSGRISGPHDPLCPILEAWRWASLDTGQSIEDSHLAETGFTAPDLYGITSTEHDQNLRGCGYLLVEQESLGTDPELDSQGSRLAERCVIRITVRVPAGFGQGQGQLYCGLLSRVLGDRPIPGGGHGSCVIGLGGDDALQFGWTPELGQIENEAGGWLGLVWEAEATRYYTTP